MLEQYLPSDRDTWNWRRSQLSDIIDMVQLSQTYFQPEMEPILQPDPALFARNIGIAVITQMHAATQEQVIVARNNDSDAVMAWAWISRGSYTTYSRDEMAEARFASLDLSLPTRTRITMLAQILIQWHLWCRAATVPVLVSSSILNNQTAFMRLHEQAGFSVRGSTAYMRVKE